MFCQHRCSKNIAVAKAQKKHLIAIMDIKQDIKDSLDKFELTKINGQPSNADMNHLTLELGAVLATIPTTNGGGDHGHVGMILDETEYTLFSSGATPFTGPKNPGPFPTTVSTKEVDRL
jgi:hypothetical protein